MTADTELRDAEAARAAAGAEATRRLDAEIRLTRRRIRALDKRWLPRLEAALAERELALDLAEQDDGVRLRKAIANGAAQ